MFALSKIFSQQAITATTRQTRMAQATTYPFEAKIASCRYYVNKNTTRVNTKKGIQIKIQS